MKSAIVLEEHTPTGLLANAAACITTGLFKDQPDAYGAEIAGADCTLISITKVPILILKKGQRTFEELLRRAKDLDVRMMIFTKEGQSTASYDEYIARTEGKALEDLTIVGLGVIGQDADITTIVGDLPLLR